PRHRGHGHTDSLQRRRRSALRGGEGTETTVRTASLAHRSRYRPQESLAQLTHAGLARPLSGRRGRHARRTVLSVLLRPIILRAVYRRRPALISSLSSPTAAPDTACHPSARSTAHG